MALFKHKPHNYPLHTNGHTLSLQSVTKLRQRILYVCLIADKLIWRITLTRQHIYALQGVIPQANQLRKYTANQ